MKGLWWGCFHSNSHTCLQIWPRELCWVQSMHLIQLVTQALNVLLCPKMLLNCHVFNRTMKKDILLNIYLINKHEIIIAFYFELAFRLGSVHISQTHSFLLMWVNLITEAQLDFYSVWKRSKWNCFPSPKAAATKKHNWIWQFSATHCFWMKFEDYVQLCNSKSMTIHTQGLILNIKWKPRYRIKWTMITMVVSFIPLSYLHIRNQYKEKCSAESKQTCWFSLLENRVGKAWHPFISPFPYPNVTLPLHFVVLPSSL